MSIAVGDEKLTAASRPRFQVQLSEKDGTLFDLTGMTIELFYSSDKRVWSSVSGTLSSATSGIAYADVPSPGIPDRPIFYWLWKVLDSGKPYWTLSVRSLPVRSEPA